MSVSAKFATSVNRLIKSAGGRVSGFLLAFSGGLDSRVLLELLREHAVSCPSLPPLRAAYVEHGLQDVAAEWPAQVRAVCREHDIDCLILKPDEPQQAGESTEAYARRLRYQALRKLLRPGEMLLLAQHADDQAETLLLQLLRGAGPHGLAGMAPVLPFADGWKARPLLEFTRAELFDYAEKRGLDWIDDPSNAESRFDRNYLRHAVLPLLRERWPGMAKTLNRSARHFAECADEIDRRALAELDALQLGERGLSVSGLLELAPALRKSVLRLWIASHDVERPSEARLQTVIGQLLTARMRNVPGVQIGSACLRRYQDTLFLLSGDDQAKRPCLEALPIVVGQPQVLGHGWRLIWRVRRGGLTRISGLLLSSRGAGAGERIRVARNRPRISLKNWFQEQGMPPWERERQWLIKDTEGRLIALVGRLIDVDCQAADDNGFWPEIERDDD